jgi:hypothetical protein
VCAKERDAHCPELAESDKRRINKEKFSKTSFISSNSTRNKGILHHILIAGECYRLAEVVYNNGSVPKSGTEFVFQRGNSLVSLLLLTKPKKKGIKRRKALHPLTSANLHATLICSLKFSLKRITSFFFALILANQLCMWGNQRLISARHSKI